MWEEEYELEFGIGNFFDGFFVFVGRFGDLGLLWSEGKKEGERKFKLGFIMLYSV